MASAYPYLINDRLSGSLLNFDLGHSPNTIPPASSHGGAFRFKQWIDTSVYPAVLRMATKERASTGYVATDWATLAYIYWNDATPKVEWGPQGGYLPLTGGTVVGSVLVLQNLGCNGRFDVLGPIGSSNSVNAPYVHASLNLNADQDLGVVRNAYINGSVSVGGGLGVAGNFTALGLYGTYLQVTDGYFPNNLGVGRNLTVGNLLSTNDIHTNVQTVNSNLIVGNLITAATLSCTTVSALGTITSGTLNTTYLSAYGTGTSIYAAQDISCGRTVFATGMQTNNIVINSGDNAALSAPGGGLTAHRIFIGTNGSFGGTAFNTVWAANGGVAGKQLFCYDPIYSNDNTFYIAMVTGQKIINFAANNYWNFEMNNGSVHYNRAGFGGWFELRTSDNVIRNMIGDMGGNSFVNNSDRRLKTNIVPSDYGLDQVLALNPVKFDRIQRRVEECDYPVPRSSPPEVGFIAQEVLEVMPEAVRIVGGELPDGTGGFDSDDPTLGLTMAPIIAAMVLAFKQINARLAALEGAT